MGLELRNGRRYYYHKRRVGGRVVSVYGGAGDVADTLATSLLYDQLRQRAGRERERRERERIREIEREIERALFLLSSVVAAALKVAGYHAHKGQWRKRRGGSMGKQGEGDVVTRTMPSDAKEAERLIYLSERLDQGAASQKEQVEFRAALAAHPWAWELFGDVGDMALETLKAKVTSQESVKIAIEEGLARLRRELGYDSAPMVERLVIDQIALCHLRLQWAENHLSRVGGIPAVVPFWEKRVNAAQRRFLRACDALGRLRKLGNLTVQVNIATNGGQQVNVAK